MVRKLVVLLLLAGSVLGLWAYEPVNDLSGNLHIEGSTSLAPLLEVWADSFEKLYSKVTVNVKSNGSEEGIQSFLKGRINVLATSRPLSFEEFEGFKMRHKDAPLQVPVAIDAVVVFVNENNPLVRVTLGDLDSMFSDLSKRSGKKIGLWADLVTDKMWSGGAIELYGRTKSSGTSQFFKEMVFKEGGFNVKLGEMAHFSMVVAKVKSNKSAIGYSALAYKTNRVKTLSVGYNGDDFFDPTFENCLSGNYPLSRSLYLYVGRVFDESKNELAVEFIKYALSREGQSTAKSEGYFPIPLTYTDELITKLGNPKQFFRKSNTLL